MIEIILLIIIAVGVKMIYDARSIVEKYFSNSDENKQIRLLKGVGFLVSIVCAIILYFLISR